MGAVGFEPTKAEPSDLQSDPFVHFGTRPDQVFGRSTQAAMRSHAWHASRASPLGSAGRKVCPPGGGFSIGEDYTADRAGCAARAQQLCAQMARRRKKFFADSERRPGGARPDGTKAQWCRLTCWPS